MESPRSTVWGSWRRWTANSDALTPVRGCAWPGCDQAGDYRAPRAPSALRDYIWFCLEHVRQYNREWDYFAGMDAGDIERVRRRDAVWHRPTWPLGARPELKLDDNEPPPIRDPFGLFGDIGIDAEPRRPQTPREQALAELGLDGAVTQAEMKARYKLLVKRHHPDANGGCKKSEERLKSINEAYTYLRNLETA